MTNKKRGLLQISFYILISFGIMFTAGFFGYDDRGEVRPVQMLCYYLAAFSPCIGCVFARYLFREGFKDGILYPGFTGHFRPYLLSVLLPAGFGITCCVLVTCVLHAGFSFKPPYTPLLFFANLAYASVQAYDTAFIIIGEELGWRAFLYDKLESVFGLHGSIIIGGIIWGLWHIPPILTIGINFGKEYRGYPYPGIALMCVLCIGAGAMMQMLRKMSGSVIAPIIAHALIDSVCLILISPFLTETLAAENRFTIGLCMVVASLIWGIPCWVYMAKHNDSL